MKEFDEIQNHECVGKIIKCKPEVLYLKNDTFRFILTGKTLSTLQAKEFHPIIESEVTKYTDKLGIKAWQTICNPSESTKILFMKLRKFCKKIDRQTYIELVLE